MTLLVDQLGKRLGGRWVLDGVSCAVAAGAALGVVGGNGAGKSTLLAVIAGVLGRDRGGVSIGGHAAGTVAAQRQLGYVPEAANPPGHLTVDEVVALVAAVKGERLDGDTRAALALDEIAAQRVDRLSLGQRRRCCLAAALVGAPRLLVLDEPTNGLDTAGIETLAALLAARLAGGAAAVIASHDDGFLSRLTPDRLHLVAGRVGPVRGA